MQNWTFWVFIKLNKSSKILCCFSIFNKHLSIQENELVVRFCLFDNVFENSS